MVEYYTKPYPTRVFDEDYRDWMSKSQGLCSIDIDISIFQIPIRNFTHELTSIEFNFQPYEQSLWTSEDYFLNTISIVSSIFSRKIFANVMTILFTY